jgi:hypothetical protein
MLSTTEIHFGSSHDCIADWSIDHLADHPATAADNSDLKNI